MNEKTLEIFELCERLAKLLGDREAIAGIKRLYERHPEMFKNVEEVSRVIKEVVSEPEIIVNAVRKDIDNPNETILKAAKRLNERKMGDVVIKNDRGVNEIFHENVRNIKKMKSLINKQVSVETPSAKAAPTWLGLCADKSNDLPKCNKTPSTPASPIIPQQSQNINNNPSQAKESLTKPQYTGEEKQESQKELTDY